MKISPVTAFLLFFVIFKVVTPVRCTEPTGRIAGGFVSDITEMPYIASLKIQKADGIGQCGGSIISQNFILTAAQCLDGATNVNVTTGTAEPSSGEGTTYMSDKFVMHPKYDSRTFLNDIGIITITEGIKLDGTDTDTVPIANKGDAVEPDSHVLIGGWGYTEFEDEISNELIIGEVQVQSNKACAEYVPRLPESAFCAGYKDGHRGTCDGDEGGPAVGFGSRMQEGVISTHGGCGGSYHPGVFTNIANSEVRDFITNHTGM